MAGRVMLVSMPNALGFFPNLALGLLKPAAEQAGFGCDVRYFSLDHIAALGDGVHAAVVDVRYYNAQIGEWVFAEVANGTPDADGAGGATGAAGTDFLSDVFAAEFPAFYQPDRILAFLAARAGAPDFIEACYASVDWAAYRVVGFTSSFQQTMASLALARRIRRDHPAIFIAIGGANCQDEMGTELHRQYSFLDAVCQGEGDRAFPELLRRLAAGESLAGIAGMVVRAQGETVVPAQSTDSVMDLDTLPIPDFDSFFEQHAALGFAARHPPALVFETARGCWWGAKQHCTFCGLNGVTMAYRAKTQERAFTELETLVRRHGTRDVANADNILEMRYFDGFIPRLAAAGLDLLIFYETKSNLKPWHWAALGRAGIRKVQAGIESLDSDILRLMRKGVTGIHNVMALKLAAEAGVYVEWLNLCGFPGERAESYTAMARLMPLLVHLQPPAGFYRARADRFSPYQKDPSRYGVRLEPLAAYRHLYPFDESVVSRIAYHFTMHSPELDELESYTGAAAAQAQAWRLHHGDSALWVTQEVDEVTVHEQRWGFSAGVTRLAGAEAALLGLCWQAISWRSVVERLGGAHGLASLDNAARALEARGWLIREDALLLSLPLRQPGFRRAPSVSEVRDRSMRSFSDSGLMDAAQPAVERAH